MDPLGLKLALAGTTLSPRSLDTMYLLSLAVDSERLQEPVWIENGPRIREGVKFHPSHPFWLRHCRYGRWIFTAK